MDNYKRWECGIKNEANKNYRFFEQGLSQHRQDG